MNRKETIAVAFAALAVMSTAGAQAPAPGTQAPTPGASPPPAASPPRLEMKPPARASREAPVTADARGCLEFPGNLEIIKCAEKYLHHKRSG